MTTKSRLLIALLATVGQHSHVEAAALGEVLAQSALSEPLRVEIRLGEDSARSGIDCLRLVSHPEVPDGLPWLAKGRIAIAGSGGSARLVVSGPAPVFDPILRFAVEDVCNSRLKREYTLLLSYPETPATPVVEPEAPSAAPDKQPVARRSQRRPEPAAAQPMAAERWTTAPGESVQSLGEALFPKDAGARQRFIAATLEANPQVVDKADAAKPLPPGTELAIPDLTRQPPSRPPRADQASAAPRTAKAKTKTEPPPRETTPPPRPTPAPVADRLLLDGDRPSAAGQDLRLATELATPPGTASDSERDLLRREQQLIMALDRITATQLALNARIRQLEEIEAALTERAAALGALPRPAAEASPAPTSSPALPAQPTEAATPNDWLYSLGLFGGLAGLLAVGLLYMRRRRTESGAETAANDTMIAEDTPDDLAAPLASQRSAEHTGFSSVGYERVGFESAAEARRSGLHAAAAPIDWQAADDLPSEPATVAPIVATEEAVEEHDSAIELAEIMVSFGRVHGAAETLAEFIRSNPKQAVTPWLKLLEVYRMAGLRPEFDALARQLNKTFNVKAVTWDNFDSSRGATDTVEQMPHIMATLQEIWGTQECQAYLQKLLRDNRDGTRQGFPLSVIDEILLLSAVLEHQLGPYRPDQPPAPQAPVSEPSVA